MGEVKSLTFKATSSKQLFSTRSAGWIWWGEIERHCLSDRTSKKQLTSLPQTQRFGASNMTHPKAGPMPRACPSPEKGGPGESNPSGYGHKCSKKPFFCSMWNTDAYSASVTNFLEWVSLSVAVLLLGTSESSYILFIQSSNSLQLQRMNITQS